MLSVSTDTENLKHWVVRVANKIYQLPLDDELDKDILDKLDKLPRSRKAEWVRTALRVYIAIEQGDMAPAVPGIVQQGKKQPTSSENTGEGSRKIPKDVEL